MNNRCPTCGAPADVRAGIRLPALKATIFRTVKAAGDIGASSQELLNAVYPDGRKPQRATIKVHVGQINDLLEETDFRIVSISKRWVLRRVP